MTSSHPVLKGKTALITGAAKRLGRATALALAREGVNVVVHYRSSHEEAQRTASALHEIGVEAWILVSDLEDPAQVDQLVQRAVDAAGHIDILVNNASIFGPSRLSDFSVEHLASNIQVNAMAPLQLARSFVAKQAEGTIVNLLDARVAHFDSLHAAYHLSKRMLLDLTRMMALEFAPQVRVNAVAPGLILPPPGQNEAYMQRLASANPLQRPGHTKAVTQAIVFLLESDFVTGQVIFVDGGYHLKGGA